MITDYRELFEHLGYTFENLDHLIQALSHRSTRTHSNERLEYLGDAILNYVIAEAIFKQYPDWCEGRMSRLRALLVSGKQLARIASEHLALSHYLRVGPGEFKTGGHKRVSILADALEALFAAVYIDADLMTCRTVILKHYQPLIEDAAHAAHHQDSKSRLQEWCQARTYQLPIYSIEKIMGKSHEQIFCVKLQIREMDLDCLAEGTSRKKAEQAAARMMLQRLQNV